MKEPSSKTYVQMVGYRIILIWLLKKQDGKASSGSVWFRIGTSCKCGNEFWVL